MGNFGVVKFCQNRQNALLVILIFGDSYTQHIAHVHWTKVWRFLIWRLTLKSPNCQIKATAKISCYTVCYVWIGAIHGLSCSNRDSTLGATILGLVTQAVYYTLRYMQSADNWTI